MKFYCRNERLSNPNNVWENRNQRDYETDENNEINESEEIFVCFVIFVFFVISLHYPGENKFYGSSNFLYGNRKENLA